MHIVEERGRRQGACTHPGGGQVEVVEYSLTLNVQFSRAGHIAKAYGVMREGTGYRWEALLDKVESIEC